MKLVSLSVQGFVGKLAEGAPVPGGGSAVALCGALAAALCSMVSRVTLGKESLKSAWEEMKRIGEEAEALAEHFLVLVDGDADAYQEVVAAGRLPRKTEEERKARLAAIQEALKKAAMVPLETLRAAEKMMHLAKPAIERGNPNAVTDAGAALHLARAAAAVAIANVRINLLAIEDEKFVEEYRREVSEIEQRVDLLFDGTVGHLELRLA